MSEVLVAEAPKAPPVPFQKEIIIVATPDGGIQMQGMTVEFCGPDGTVHAQPKSAPMTTAECCNLLSLLQAGLWAQIGQEQKGKILVAG